MIGTRQEKFTLTQHSILSCGNLDNNMATRPNKNDLYKKHSWGFRYVYSDDAGGEVLPIQQPKLTRTQDVIEFQDVYADSDTINIPKNPYLGQKLDSPLYRFIEPLTLDFVLQNFKKLMFPMYKKYFKTMILPVGATDVEMYTFYTINKEQVPEAPDGCYLHFKAHFKSGKIYIGIRQVVGGGDPVQ